MVRIGYERKKSTFRNIISNITSNKNVSRFYLAFIGHGDRNLQIPEGITIQLKRCGRHGTSQLVNSTDYPFRIYNLEI